MSMGAAKRALFGVIETTHVSPPSVGRMLHFL
jgi:hypothetical protein